MPRPKPMTVNANLPHPMVRAFPRASLAVQFVGVLFRAAGNGVRVAWPWRRELALITVVCGLWWWYATWLPGWWSLAVAVSTAGVPLLLRPVRDWVWGWLRCSRTRRQIRTGLAETRSANTSGRLPRVARIRTTAVGERIALRVPPGQSAELLDVRVEELRAAARCREVRITRDPNRSHRITLDVVRRDPLTGAADIPWADLEADALSMWDPITIGVNEAGDPFRLSLVERGLIGAGEPGAG